ncbi:MAG: hypothetical protein WC344_04845 [Bacilli bacterium]|jgi:hypothetical protein
MIKEFGLPYIVHLLLVIFIGPLWAGIIRVVRGKVILGILYIISGGFFAVGWIIDIVMMLTKKDLWAI